MHDYYDFIMQGIPIAFMLTLSGTLKPNKKNAERFLIVCVTMLTSAMSFFLVGALSFQVGFGAWVDVAILYEHKNNRNVTIKEQVYDVGALGYGGMRTVKLTPFLKFWYKVTEVDSTKINRHEWVPVNKELIIY